MAAILQSANILANNSQMYQNANTRIFDAITQAANAYEERQRLKMAALEKERERAAAQQAAQQDIMLNPEKAIMQIQTKASTNAPLTPQEQATLETAKGVLSSKQNVDQYGRPYRAYDFSAMGTADVMAPVPAVQVEELPASPVGQVMSMRPPVKDGLLPPPAALSAGEQRMPVSEFTQEAPPPIGEAAPKSSAVGSVRPPKMIQGAAGPIADPVDLERYKAELAAAKESDIKNAATEAEAKKADFGKNKLQNIIEQMKKVNDELKAAGGLKSSEQGIAGNAMDTLRGAKLPILGIEVGKAVEGVVDPKVAKLKQEYERLRALGFQFYKNASGLSASQMNTEKEQELALSVFGDTSGFYEANKSALENLAREYGTGKGADSGLDKTDPRVKRALDAGYTEEQVKAFLNGRK